jgi:hypothetical protein
MGYFYCIDIVRHTTEFYLFDNPIVMGYFYCIDIVRHTTEFYLFDNPP